MSWNPVSILILLALTSMINCVPLEGNLTQRFFLPYRIDATSLFLGVLGEDLSELLIDSPNDYLNEDIDFDEFPDPFEYDIDETQKAEESLLGLFPFSGFRNAQTRNKVRATYVAENTQGTCIDIAKHSGKSVAGLSAGAANIQCCIPQATTCSSNGKSGVCMASSSSKGTSVASWSLCR